MVAAPVAEPVRAPAATPTSIAPAASPVATSAAAAPPPGSASPPGNIIPEMPASHLPLDFLLSTTLLQKTPVATLGTARGATIAIAKITPSPIEPQASHLTFNNAPVDFSSMEASAVDKKMAFHYNKNGEEQSDAAQCKALSRGKKVILYAFEASGNVNNDHNAAMAAVLVDPSIQCNTMSVALSNPEVQVAMHSQNQLQRMLGRASSTTSCCGQTRDDK